MKRIVTAVCMMMLLLTGIVSAQDGVINLSLAVPDTMSDAYSAELLAQFEASYPGVKVHIVKSGTDAYYNTPSYGLDAHYAAVEKYVSSADVLYTNNYNLSPESTRAGFWLDLAPLTQTDRSFNPADFAPPIWKSYQWDAGVWAIPASASLYVIVYNPVAFDEAGLAYPNESWTMNDFANAARALTKRDSAGNVTAPGLLSHSNQYLFRSLYGQSFSDTSVTPNSPRLSDPTLEQLLATWHQLEQEGAVGALEGMGNTDTIPLRIEMAHGLIGGGEIPRAAVLLPGSRAGLYVDGFSVSGGTQYPEYAYALAKFLTTRVEVVSGFYGNVPARNSLAGATELFSGVDKFPVEVQPLITNALANAFPISDILYDDYLRLAQRKMDYEGLDALSALQSAEARAVSNLQMASERRAITSIHVTLPPSAINLAAGEVSLRFGITTTIMPLPSADLWDAVIQEFIASDPQVRQIIIETDFTGDLTQATQDYDCFYRGANLVPELALDTVINLDPFMNADATFNPADVIGSNTLAQLQRENRTWAYPMGLSPQVMWYNRDAFNAAGMPAPQNGWTVDVFNSALQTLKTSPDAPAPFISYMPGGNHLLMLTASYGGLPIDYRTNPPTVNFTDPTNAQAMQQVLDLASAGLVDYQKLGDMGGGMPPVGAPLYTSYIDAFSFISSMDIVWENPNSLTTFPRGSQYTPVSYDIGTAYISASTPNPEACYRWIKTVAQHPELKAGMPAFYSLLDDTTLETIQGTDAAAVYRDFGALLSEPSVVFFPSPFRGTGVPGDTLFQYWLYQAFDNYVLEGANLQTELQEAQLYADAFQACRANLPAYNPSTPGDYVQQVANCAASVDPAAAQRFFNVG